MSYQVLARKWRPRSFHEMVGQEHVLKALINALDHNRLHHAYLFTGTRGVGKTTISRILARCLNCEMGVSSNPCGECSACLEINEGRFVDLIEVDAASRTKVEDTRDLLDNVQYAPTRGRYKIYLIDEVHMLSSHSFNALLKTLEEPPEHVKFLLATTDPQKLPITVLSRCLQFNLKNMSPERIVGHLQHVLGEEMVPCDDAALWQLARSADGSMRDALSLTDQAIAYGNGKIADADVTAMLGTIDHKLIEQLVAALAEVNGQALLEAVASFSEHAPDYHAALGDLTTLLHRIAIGQALPDALDNSYGDREQILRFAHSLAPEEVQLFYQTALIGRRDLHLSPDARGGFEMVLLRMLTFKPQGVVDVPTQALPSSTTAPSVLNSDASSPTPEPSPPMDDGLREVPPQNTEAVPAPPEPIAPPETVVEPEPIQEPTQVAPPEVEPVPAQVIPSPEPEQEGNPAKKSKLDLSASPLLAELKPASEIPRPAKAEVVQDAKKTVIAEQKEAIAASVESVKPASLQEFAPENWIAVYEAIKVRGVLQSTASNCVLLGREGNQLYFALDQDKASLFDGSHSKRLSDLLGDYFAQPVSVAIELQSLPEGATTPLMNQQRLKHEAKTAAIESLNSDPIVQALQQDLGAELNPDSVTYKL